MDKNSKTISKIKAKQIRGDQLFIGCWGQLCREKVKEKY